MHATSDGTSQRVVLSSDINFFETGNKIVYRIGICLFRVLSGVEMVQIVGTGIKTQPFLLQGAEHVTIEGLNRTFSNKNICGFFVLFLFEM